MFFNIDFNIFPDDMSIDERAEKLLDLQIKTDNEREGSLRYYDCPICKNKGIVYFKNDSGREAIRECECRQIRDSYKKIAESGLKNELDSKTFNSYICKYPFQKEAIMKAKKYIEDNSGAFFYIGGQSGAGKTHLCTAISGKLLSKGYPLKYFKWATDASYIISLSANEDRERKEAAMKAPLTIPILYIDDFLRNKQPTQAEIKLAFSIIDTRYQNGLKTIISSEKSLKELHGIDEALTGRIYERTNKKEYYIDISRNPNYNFRRADI